MPPETTPRAPCPPRAPGAAPMRTCAALGTGLALAGLAVLGLAGCGSMGGTRTETGPRTEMIRVPTADGEAARGYLADLAELSSSPPARQAEILKAAHDAVEATPTTANRLRYALMLADPSHGGSDPVAARRQLSEILARPEWALPSERALAGLALRETESRLSLAEDSRRLATDAGAHERDKAATLSRRLSSEQDENARLRRALDEAQKKLEAVTQLERASKERGNAQGGN